MQFKWKVSFKPLSQLGSSSLGFTEATAWIKVSTSNIDFDEGIRYWGSIRPELSQVSLYVFQNKSLLKEFVGGSSLESSEKIERSRLNLFP